MRKFKKYVYSSKSFDNCFEATSMIADENNKDFIIGFNEEIGIYNGYLLVNYEDL